MRCSFIALRLAAVPMGASLCVCALGLPARAQTVTTLPETVVTAARSPQRADAVIADLTVIDRAQIERHAARTLPELLARVAGVQFAANGGRGTVSSVFIRGAESRHTLLLVDGVRYGSATVGAPVWEGLPLEAIERIEVLKGPASALYGSDAVGGVVQVFTRQGREGLHPHAALSVGSQRWRQASAGLAGGQGALQYAIAASANREQGESATNPGVPFGSFNPDHDPFEQNAFNGTLGWRFAPGWKLELGGLASRGESHYDDGPGRDTYARLRSSVARASVAGSVREGWRTQLTAARSADQSEAVVAAFLPGNFKTTQDQLLWQNDLGTPAGTLVLGVERLKQRVAGSTAYVVRERSIDSLFASLSGEAGPHGWQASLRRDRNSQFGQATTGLLGYALRLTPGWRVFGSHGTSFVAPSFNQLYFPNFGTPTLQPEEGRNTDLGLGWSADGHSLKLVRFDNRIRGFIPSGPLPQNVPRARIEGTSLAYEGALGPVALRAHFELLDARNELTGRRLARRAERTASLGADWAASDAWRLGATLQHAGARFDDAANTARLGSYTTLDLSAQWQLARDWALQAQLRNLGGAAYETVRGYNQPGRGAFLTLRWAPR